jgi:hypothetical protein
MPSPRLSTAGTSSSNATSPFTKFSSEAARIGLWRLTANRISEIFGVRLHRRLRGKLATVIDQIEHGHHVFRAYWKNAFLKQYEKFPATCATNSAPTTCATSA